MKQKEILPMPWTSNHSHNIIPVYVMPTVAIIIAKCSPSEARTNTASTRHGLARGRHRPARVRVEGGVGVTIPSE